MMLGAIPDYINAWLFPVVGIFIVIWIVGGGYLIRRSFTRHGYDRRLTLGRGMLASFLARLAGVFASNVMMLVIIRLSVNSTVVLIGAVFALAVELCVAIIVLYAMFGLSAKQTISASLIPLGAVTAAGLILMTGYLIPTRMEVLKRARRAASYRQLVRKISPAYFSYVNTYHKSPKDLRVLVDMKLLEPDDLRSPLNPGREIGYFYFPIVPKPDKTLQQIIACDFRNNTDGNGRAVLLVQGGGRQWYSEAEFQKLLQRKENADFAKALKAAEDK